MNNVLIESQIEMKTGGILNTSLIVDQWPEFELEQLGCCPVCGDKERSVLFSGLADTVAKVAPGKWTLWQCGGLWFWVSGPKAVAAKHWPGI